MKVIQGWGRYPRLKADVLHPISAEQATNIVMQSKKILARGLARSYGDCSLEERVLETRYFNHFLDFDEDNGLLTCEAGVSLDEILKVFVPRGWFLPVTPGTRFVTVGGAIACDVHGKNHHVEGTFSDHVTEMNMLLGNGEIVTVSPIERTDLFRATCGGDGLTGIIISATIRMKPIKSSSIVETTIKAPNLETVLDAFNESAGTTYSVAWIDCLARGKNLGRSLLMVGEHATEGALSVNDSSPLPVPIEVPAFFLNKMTVKSFNTLFYAKSIHARHQRLIPFEPFFYPLDKLSDWNRLYGRPGFLQYQFVIPMTAGAFGLRDVINRIAVSGRGSFLAVLKQFGKGNQNHLSFPYEGYTLALDFKAEPAVFKLLDELDRVILDYGGRLYLTKDSRMNESTFKAGYPRWEEFEEVRTRYHAVGKFSSIQAKRLGLQ